MLEVPLGTATPYGVQSGPDGSRVYVADYPKALTYDAAERGYTFRWKTDKSLAGTRARLSVALADGTAHTADFSFR